MGRIFDSIRTVVRVRYLAGALSLSAAGGGAILMNEGSVDHVYLDPVGIPTACAGSTEGLTRADVGRYMPPEVCAQRIKRDTSTAERAVKACVTQPVTQEQYDAFVDTAFNIGRANFCGSTLVRKHNAGDCRGATQEFGRWVYAKGKKLPGLITRRERAATAYATGC
jgi:lysozyme